MNRYTKPRLDLRGNRFSKLVVLRFVRMRNGKSLWKCACSCGRSTTVAGSNLLSGNSTSCGKGEHERGTTHGLSRTTEYRIWQGMISRCVNEKSVVYKYYGGRGIKVCSKWRNSFPAFLSDVGERPSLRHTLDRKNTNGHYTPRNVKWSTQSEQLKNRRKMMALQSFPDSELLAECKRRRLSIA